EYTDEELLDINHIEDDDSSTEEASQDDEKNIDESLSALEELENIEESIDENPEESDTATEESGLEMK
ncbi:hypothetical protein SU45_11170, partial [Brachyspira hyodysenteriae]